MPSVHRPGPDRALVHRFSAAANDPARRSAYSRRAHCSRRRAAGCWPAWSVCLLLGGAPAPAAAAQSGCRGPAAGRWPGTRRGRGLRRTRRTRTGRVIAESTWPPGPVCRCWPAAAGTVAFAGSVAGRGWSASTTASAAPRTSRSRAGCAAGQRVGSGQPIGRVSSGRPLCGPVPALGPATSGRLPGSAAPGRPVHAGPLRLLAAADRGGGGEAGPARGRRPRPAVARLRRLPSAAGRRPRLPAPGAGSVTSAFGMRFHPVLRGWKLHDGTDFGAGCGTPIRAPYAGTVTAAYFNAGYGNRLIIDHGRWTASACRPPTTTRPATWSDRVSRSRRGQLIGYVGSTGYSTGLPPAPDGLAERPAGGPDDLVLGRTVRAMSRPWMATTSVECDPLSLPTSTAAASSLSRTDAG